ncbi:MAG: hypothetical protein M3M94_00625 [Actinomycetota bacterium]|nr:hypothetical protein [Actinomycetota bacterium]
MTYRRRHTVVLLAALALACAGTASAEPGHRSGYDRTVELSGTVHVSHSDNFARGRARFYYSLKTRRGLVRLRLGDHVRRLRAGARVRLVGKRNGKTFRVSRVAVARQPSALAGTAALVGPRKLAVVLFNFSNDTSQPFTAEQARGTVFTNPNSVSAYYSEQSFGKLSFTGKLRSDGDVFGWYTIGLDSSGCRIGDWTTAARSAAAAAGVDLSGYDHVVYAFPRASSCGWAGLGEVPGTRSWINGQFNLTTIAHEVGHNLAMHHAASQSCSDGSGRRVTISSSCTAVEYGDPFDIMGSGWTRHTSNWHKAQLGWLPAVNLADVLASGTYSLAPQERTLSAVQLLRIPRGSTGWNYCLEFRQPFGSYFDNFSTGDPVVNGVTIRLCRGYSDIVQSYLLDATPETGGFGDASLPVGRSFTDAEHGISVTTQSVSTSGASVSVTLGGSPPPPPPPSPDTTAPSAPSSLAAQALSGPKVNLSWAAATDNVGVAGYRIYREGALLATTTGTTYTDASVASSATYGYTVRAFDAAGNASAASNVATVTTPAAADTTAPNAPGSLTGQALSGPKVSLSWAAASDNVGVAGYRIFRDGAVVGTTTGTSYTDASVASSTSYTYAVRAYDAAGNVSAASNAVTVTTPAVTPPPSATDTIAPTAPTNLIAQRCCGGGSTAASLSWAASRDNVGVVGYIVYRNGFPIGTTTTTSFTDWNLGVYSSFGGVSYVVRAYDKAGNKSLASNKATLR